MFTFARGATRVQSLARVSRVTLIVLALAIVVPVGVAVAWSVLGDAAMLVDELGVLGLALFLVVPLLVWLFGGPGRTDR